MPSMDQKRLDRDGPKVHILQDVHDAFLLLSKRRIAATIMTLLTLLHFVKIMAVAGPFDTIGIVAVLAGVHFTYWLYPSLLTAPLDAEQCVIQQG
ncbi:hypothetical protein B0T18DRAFT_430166 [Schizothecium vesticola]|uniref:Uncharacterized protein n=1 Tax=Schizothecium vesticola TaxID=314040 RepID=A0AA40K1U5_9PEZI|nr:hypothetical protein B0T18DRAFT_430166 [Schizothecium vesticola]